MDIISGIVVTTSALILGVALTGIIAINSASRSPAERGQQEVFAGARGIQGTMLVVYFVATTHLLLIAQQVNLALANFVVGLVLIVVQFVEPSLRGGRRSPGEQEDWRR
jgi:hypothetical protein